MAYIFFDSIKLSEKKSLNNLKKFLKDFKKKLKILFEVLWENFNITFKIVRDLWQKPFFYIYIRKVHQYGWKKSCNYWNLKEFDWNL